MFQSTRPARGATAATRSVETQAMVSIHAPRAGRDTRLTAPTGHAPRFNPRAPRGARHYAKLPEVVALAFQSTRPARGATDLQIPVGLHHLFQSTRPARGATKPLLPVCIDGCFNPRAPRGARHSSPDAATRLSVFQSTRPARGATLLEQHYSPNAHGFNPRAPRGARPRQPSSFFACSMFQSTRPARGATGCPWSWAWWTRCFNPRAPRGARRFPPFLVLIPARVSIHAPRAGRDRVPMVLGVVDPLFQSTRPARGATISSFPRTHTRASFNPRAPRGARHFLLSSYSYLREFQSTRPARGATGSASFRISHTSLFQSTRPARGATAHMPPASSPPAVSIHAPRAGRDVVRWFAGAPWACFNPRAPRGARLTRFKLDFLLQRFQSTRPARGATGVRTDRHFPP